MRMRSNSMEQKYKRQRIFFNEIVGRGWIQENSISIQKESAGHENDYWTKLDAALEAEQLSEKNWCEV